ncbi:MAG TPA: FAD-binding protein [Vicinamibacterales bacterium]|nr:FAD-binding protein [Vicinamibacterales bacterium]
MNPNRRALLCASLGAGAGLVSTGGTVAPVAQAETCDRPPVGGDWSCDPIVRRAAATDFGRIISRTPRAVHRPSSRADVAGSLRWASKRGLKVAARGQGHSIYGRALAENGIVVDMGAMNAVGEVQPDRVVVEAGATWATVVEATLKRGLTPPVLTNYLGLSIGGTIAIGGIGGASSSHGLQTDQILELDVVTGDGRELTCSADANPDLFDAVRAGLGKCGIVTRATLRLVRAPAHVRRFQLFYPDLAVLMTDQRGVLDERRFDQLQGAVLPDPAGGWRYQLEGAVFHDGTISPGHGGVLEGLSDTRRAAVIMDSTYRDDVHSFAKFQKLLTSNGQWLHPQPWLLTFLRGSNAQSVARAILDELTTADVGPFGRITCYPMSAMAVRTPQARLTEEPVVFPFNLIRIPASNDRSSAERMVAQNRVLYERIRNAGGTLYPVSAVPMSSDDWRHHFGSAWQPLRDAMQHYDPANILAPGYDLLDRA